MTRESGGLRSDAAWHTSVRRLSASLAILVAVGSSSSAQAAGVDETCGRIGTWSEECDQGLECDLFWKWRRWSLGNCVAGDKRCGGDLPEQCGETEYCAFEEPGACGFADEPGVCKPRPELCTEQYQPVCGCNGESYANPCYANAAGAAVQHEGPCSECMTDADCPHGVCDIGVSCAGLSCPPPPPNRCTVCGDGSQLLCRRAAGPCPAGEVREIVDSCYGRCVDRVSCEPTTCEYEGQTHPIGEGFPASDGCNECRCSDDGDVQCTLKLCACNYDDPKRGWVARSPEACQTVRFTCVEDQQAFFDECGCGCEPIPDACHYEGETYPLGATFPASDGCNECRCTEDGSVQCTLKLCACDYEEASHSWVSRDPEVCARVLFVCTEGYLPFFDECGCGCEPASPCKVGGCSGQLCVARGDEGISTCEWREEYACYASATCEQQPDGACGWTPTEELEQCIEDARSGESR